MCDLCPGNDVDEASGSGGSGESEHGNGTKKEGNVVAEAGERTYPPSLASTASLDDDSFASSISVGASDDFVAESSSDRSSSSTTGSTGSRTTGGSNTSPSTEFVEVCRAVQDNDPSITSVTINDDALCHPEHALTLCTSLRSSNTHVRLVQFDFGRHVLDSWRTSSAAVSTWTDYLSSAPLTLRAIELHNATPLLSSRRERRRFHKDDDGAAACTTLWLILQALASNQNISELILNNSHANNKTESTTAASSTAVTSRKPFSTSCVFTLPTTLQTATVETLSQCQFLDTLWLEHVEDTVLCALLQQLVALPALQSLVIVPLHRTISTATTAVALAQLLRSSTVTNLAHLEFHSVRFSFKLLQCLFLQSHNPTQVPVSTSSTNEVEVEVETQSTARVPVASLSIPRPLELSLHDCSLDWGATHCFRTRLFASTATEASSTSTFTITQPVRTLTLGRNVRFYGGPVGAVSALWTNISMNHRTTVQELDLSNSDWDTTSWIKLFTMLDTKATAAALSASPPLSTALSDADNSSTTILSEAAPLPSPPPPSNVPTHLARLTLGQVTSMEQVQVLKEYIPRMRGLQYLSLQVDWVDIIEASQQNDGITEPHATTDEATLRHNLLTTLQANTTLGKCQINDQSYNLFHYPDTEASIYDRIMEGVLSQE